MTTVSIIMATRNAQQFLPEALASVPRALGDVKVDFEILIADGDSRDETTAIAAAFPGTRLVSRRDAGIYDAMNLAIAAASGTYCLILNSDDLLLDGKLGQAIQGLDMRPDADFASAPALFGTSLAGAVTRIHSGPLTAEGAMFGIPAINSRLFRRPTLQGVGPIRTDLGLAADREFLLRLASARARGIGLEEPLYLYRIHAGSHTISGDGAGRERVYEAEFKLAKALATHRDPEVSSLARAAGAVARLKQRLRGTKADDMEPHRKANLVDLCRGLALALKWRGRLSGY